MKTFPIRINGKVTSVSIRPHVASLYCALSSHTIDDHEYCNMMVKKCAHEWVGKTGKGLGEYVMHKMIKAVLDKEDYERYKKIFRKIC